MAEYIEREAGCRRYCFHYDACSYHITEETKLLTVNECPLFVNKADVAEVRHGEWEEIIDTGSTIYRYQHTCGACGKSYFDYNKFNYPYCPNCGAKMGGKGEGE